MRCKWRNEEPLNALNTTEILHIFYSLHNRNDYLMQLAALLKLEQLPEMILLGQPFLEINPRNAARKQAVDSSDTNSRYTAFVAVEMRRQMNDLNLVTDLL